MLHKTLMLNDIVIEIIKRTIQSALLNVMINKIFPLVIKLFTFLGTGSYYLILIYMVLAVVIFFILYKIYSYFTSNKKLNKLNKLSSEKISSILSKSSYFDFNSKKKKK